MQVHRENALIPLFPGATPENAMKPALRESVDEELAALLAGLATYVGELWPERPGYVAQFVELRARLVEQRLQIAVLGQFKRGKSTFLNALLGAPVLPTGVLPLTAVPTFIQWAPQPRIEAAYLDGRRQNVPANNPGQITDALFHLVTEEGNPRNGAGVARVDLFFPAAVLGHGIMLIDTPGIGSTFRHNTDTALAVLPACDAGFFVLSADPPVTPVELEYLERVRANVSRLFFILNKIDYLAVSERFAALDFLRSSLHAHMPAETDIPIFALSARRALEAKQTGDSQGLCNSGLSEIERHLAQFLAREKTEVLHRAIAAKSTIVLDSVRMDVGLGVRALEMPLEDLEARAAEFRDALREIERQRLVARDLVAGDRRRAAQHLEARAEALRDQARSVLTGVIDRALGGTGSSANLEHAGKEAIATAIPAFFTPKLEDFSGAFAGEVEAMLAGHVQRAENLIASVRQTAATLFEIPSIPSEGANTFTMARQPFWVTQKWDETLGALAGGSLDRLLPASVRVARIKNRLAGDAEELVQRNVENLRWATLQNLDDAFRRFSGWFDERLAEQIGATRGAIETALARRREHAAQAQTDLARLRQAAEWLAAVQRDLDNLQSARSVSSDKRAQLTTNNGK